MALALPSIMTKIDETLLVKELNARMFDNVIREDLLREALTPLAAEAGFNYERLEILGMINLPFYHADDLTY